MTATDAPMLEMRGITKRFPGVLASDSVDFSAWAGEVHTLLGENGAGKSTLMKILFGLYRPDEGEILLHGKPSEVHSPASAIAHGIGMIHQHFMLVPSLTVVENVALGLKPGRRVGLDLDSVAQRIVELSDTYGLHVDPWARIWQLSVGERQRVEIIKALYRDAQLLVLDEPTAVLTPQEVDELFVILRGMCERGRALIFISHKLHEVMELSDRITVLRDGRVVGETTPDQTSPEGLAQMMVGRPVKMAPDKDEIEPGPALLTIEGLTVRGDRDQVAVDALDLEVHSGEILGIAGVSGNGQRELAEAIAGLREVESGRIELDGHDITGAEPNTVRRAGLSYVPEERMKEGAVGDFTVAENLMLLNHAEEQYCRHGVLRFGPMREHCSELVRNYRVKTPSLNTTVKSLSGGNIQKLILARELAAAPKVLLAAQPTRGVDIGAAEYIHDQLVKRRSEGMGILLISEDLDEVLGLSDRIAVMFEGRIVGIVDRADAKVEELGLLMAGSTVSA